MAANYAGPPPPASSLGAWLLKRVQEIAECMEGLVIGQSGQTAQINQLIETVAALQSAVERSSKIQSAQAVELEEVKARVHETQRQLNGVKISRGLYKARAQKVLKDIEIQLH